MKKTISTVGIFVLLALPVAAQNFSPGFVFYLPPDDTSSQDFLPQFPVVPITPSGFVEVSGDGHFSVNGTRIRFWGVNAAADGAFPALNEAWSVAGRLRKMGVNLVRLHHLDNPWSSQSLFEWGSDTRHFNPNTLLRLEKFIYELKKNGIRINMNLHVSRTFKEADGIADADSIPDFGKGVGFFDPAMLSLYKEYATQLLTHVNPSTRLALVDDPVMAMVEITNENSLTRMWRDNQLKPLSQGGKLTIRHNRMLDSLWNVFLVDRYQDTEQLREAWSGGERTADSTDQIRNGGFETAPNANDWLLEEHSPANAAMGTEVTDPYSGRFCARLIVSETDGIDWHIQWKQTRLSQLADSIYTIRFAGRTDAERTITVSVMLERSPWTVYGSSTFVLTTAWKEYSFHYRASETRSKALRISFSLGREAGTYWFDDVRWTYASVRGLEEGESLEAGTVRRIDYTECTGFTDGRVRDMSAFIIRLQDDFFAEITRHLKDVLGVKVPITFTNWNVGPGDLVIQSKADYLDNHAYWDHPQFPNIPWSSTDWLINNTPMVEDPNGGTIPWVFGGVASSGKPFTVSEYNHPFPNRYQTEGMLFLAAYGAFHDADAVMVFDYGGSVGRWAIDKVESYFSVHRNTVMMALMPSCAMAFRQGLIAPAEVEVGLSFSADDVLLRPKIDTGSWMGMEWYPPKVALSHAVRIVTFESPQSADSLFLPAEPESPYVSDTGEIVWDTQGGLGVNAPGFAGCAGFLDRFSGHPAGPFTILSGSGFAAITLTALDNEPLSDAGRCLLTLSTMIQNTGMVWDGTQTFHDRWGSPPTLVYPQSLRLRLNFPADSLRIIPLDPLGAPGSVFRTCFPDSLGSFSVVINQNLDPTVWFGVERFGDGSGFGFPGGSKSPDQSVFLFPAYPNPFNPQSSIRYRLGAPARVRLTVYNLDGRMVSFLVDENRNAGVHTVVWDGKDNRGVAVGSGVYLARLEAGGFTKTVKMVLMK